MTRWLPKALIVLVLLIFAFPDTARLHAQADCAGQNGLVEERTYRSAILNAGMAYVIYTPPCYSQTTRRYPVVYLMHGSDATDTGYWLRLGLVEALDQGIVAGALPPMIVVLPYGDWIANSNQFGPVSWANVFLNELMPDVEESYRVEGRREMRAIGGISRGGFWAFHIAFLYPELFGTVGGHSPFFHPDHWRPANPLFLAQDAPGVDTLRIWMDHGKFDYAGPNIDLMHRNLTARGVPHVYIVYPEGRHSGEYWAAHVFDYLLFYGSEWLKLEQQETPVPIPPTATPPPARLRKADAPTLFLPVVGYRSLQVSLPVERLHAVRAGHADDKLVLDLPTAEVLLAHGVQIHPATRLVEPEALLPLLESDRSLFALRAFADLTPRFRMLRIDEVPVIYGLINGDLDDYPFVFGPFARDKLTTFMFSGVTAIVRDTAAAVDSHGTAWASDGLRGFTRRADFFHVSNEVSFHPTCPHFEGGRPRGPFCAKDAYLDVLRYLGVDVVELSGNHNLDYGPEAYLRTLDMYRAQGMATVGGGAVLEQARQPLLIAHNGNRIALLSCNWIGPQFALATEESPGAAFCDDAWLAAAIPRLKAENDVVIVTVQYQEFESFVPTPKQRADFRRLAELGADVVLGTQAHLPQTFEFYPVARGGEAYLHYGLGNLYFYHTYFHMRSFLPELYIYAGQLRAVDLNVAIIDDLGRPRMMDEHNRTHFMAHMFVQ